MIEDTKKSILKEDYRLIFDKKPGIPQIILGLLLFAGGLFFLIRLPVYIYISILFGTLLLFVGFNFIVGFIGSLCRRFLDKHKKIKLVFVIAYFLPLALLNIALLPIILYNYVSDKIIKMEMFRFKNIPETLLIFIAGLVLSFILSYQVLIIILGRILPGSMNLHVLGSLLLLVLFNYLNIVIKRISISFKSKNVSMDDDNKRDFERYKAELHVVNVFFFFLLVLMINLFDISSFLGDDEQVFIHGINVAFIIYIAYDRLLGKWRTYQKEWE